jgi:hypothetical protein
MGMSTVFFIAVLVILIIEILIFRLTYRTEDERQENRYKLTWMMGVTVFGYIAIEIYNMSRVHSAESSSTSQREEHGWFGKKKKEAKSPRARPEKPAKTGKDGHVVINDGGTTYHGDGGGHETIMLD